MTKEIRSLYIRLRRPPPIIATFFLRRQSYHGAAPASTLALDLPFGKLPLSSVLDISGIEF
jgi:hypothetical protein